MTREMEIQTLETRLRKIKARGKNEKCPGVARKLQRKINKLRAQN